MAAIADITVKKADGATNIVYNGIAGASGDGFPAFFRQDTGAAAGLPVGMRPNLRMYSKWNSARNARVCSFDYEYPYALLDSTTNKYSVTDKVVCKNGAWTYPTNLPQSVIDEAVSQYTNLLASALIVSSLKSGFAPV